MTAAGRLERRPGLMLMRYQAKQREIQKQFGLGRPPISFESYGYKLVAVGPELHWSKNWKTFPDFLMDYFKKVMGAEWGQAELAKQRHQWHPLFAWYAMTCEYQGKVISTLGEPQSYPATGAASGIMWLTYGLYLLRHNVEIQLRLLERLRSADPVQIFGAVHEVIVATAMIRAGFELALEDEGDGDTTHCEFNAKSKITGKRFSVEVKVCDPGATNARNRTVRQLSRALAKAAAHPRIVCIDLNRPLPTGEGTHYTEELLKKEMRRIRQQEANFKVGGGPAPPAYIMLSNFPFRFDLEGTSYLRGAILEGFKIPRLSSDARFASLRELSEFNHEHADPIRVAQSFLSMEVPSTLNGELPGREFGKPGTPILIGERYLVPDGNGQERPGELISAALVENQKSVMGMVHLDDGPTVIVSMPITDDELNIYRESPETFFGKYEPDGRINHPVELYDWLLSVYRHTSRERLLQWLARAGQKADRFEGLSQEELAKVYCEGIALGAFTSQRPRADRSV
jgi:hypothetical protein